ncbi:CPBP family intramembrane glutamic endopeptidase [Bacillus sp. AK128]
MQTSFSQFTKPVLIGMLLVTVGAELLLWGSGYSYFLDELYMYLLIASIFLAVPLHRTWKEQDIKRSRLYYLFQFCTAFLVCFTLTYLLDHSTASYLDEFMTGYQEDTEDHLGYAPTFYEDIYFEEEDGDYSTYHLFENLDYYGSSITRSVLAGLEEVSRISYILLTMCLISLIYRRYKPERSQFPALLTGLFLSSLMFGIGHILANEYTFSESFGSFIYYTNVGLILGVLLIWTRNLWMMIAVHGLYNLSMSLNIYFFEYSSLIIILLVFLMWTVFGIVLFNKRRLPNVQQEVKQVQL